jgi:hypothetical protein
MKLYYQIIEFNIVFEILFDEKMLFQKPNRIIEEELFDKFLNKHLTKNLNI